MTLLSVSGGVRFGRRACACVGSAVVLVCAGSQPARAQTPAPATQAPAPAPAAPEPDPLSFFKSTEIGGLVDAYYDWYSTKPVGDAKR